MAHVTRHTSHTHAHENVWQGYDTAMLHRRNTATFPTPSPFASCFVFTRGRSRIVVYFLTLKVCIGMVASVYCMYMYRCVPVQSVVETKSTDRLRPLSPPHRFASPIGFPSSRKRVRTHPPWLQWPRNFVSTAVRIPSLDYPTSRLGLSLWQRDRGVSRAENRATTKN